MRRELRIDPAQVIGIIRHTVSLLPLSTRNIRSTCIPKMPPSCAKNWRAPAGEQEWQLSEDPLMARGGCRLTTDNSSIDARFETVVAAAMSALLGDERAERAAPEREGTE